MQNTTCILAGRPELDSILHVLENVVGAVDIDQSRFGRDDPDDGTIVFVDAATRLSFRLYVQRSHHGDDRFGPDHAFLSLPQTERGTEILRQIVEQFGGRIRPVDLTDEDAGWEDVAPSEDAGPVADELHDLVGVLSPIEISIMRSIMNDPEKVERVIESLQRVLTPAFPRR